MKIVLVNLLLLILLVSCKTDTPDPTYKYNNSPNFTWGYAEFFGAFYKDYKIENNVITLNLFSDSLYINEKGNLAGIGQYLFIEDIFISPADTILPEGQYLVSDKALPLTFYKGEKLEIDDNKFTVGAYVYFIEKNKIYSTLKFITSGSFLVTNQDDNSQKITCNFLLSDSTVLKGQFKAMLPHFDNSLKIEKVKPVRKKIIFENPSLNNL
jgi:hypothetical protein